MQKDAIERLGLKKLLLEPEVLQTLTPDVNLAATLVSLSHAMPKKAKDTARLVVRKVCDDLERKLGNPMREAVRGATPDAFPDLMAAAIERRDLGGWAAERGIVTERAGA